MDWCKVVSIENPGMPRVVFQGKWEDCYDFITNKPIEEHKNYRILE